MTEIVQTPPAAPRPVDPRPRFAELERRVLERWREHSVFEESVRRREGGRRWVFYEAPPTVNAPPGFHHLLTRVLKDAILRYRTMLGDHAERKAGWDCHGLPMEITVERQLGFSGKDEIERYGIAEFNARCRELAVRHARDWTSLTERIGFWIDLEGAFWTHDAPYIDSVWSALRTIFERGLLYEGQKVLPYCPRCGTGLSSHELAHPGVYRAVADPSAYVALRVVDPVAPLRDGDELVVWTTTPWTLVANGAVAIGPDLTYVRVRSGDRVFVVAEAALERLPGAGERAVLDRFPGRALQGARYEPPFAQLPASAFGPRGHTVLPGEFVTLDEGTGCVHIAVAFGEDDFRFGRRHELPVVNPVRKDGRYDHRMGHYAGRSVKDAEPELLEALERHGMLLRAESRVHPYPHCWRCDTPLLYYAKPSWFIRTSALRDRLLACNDEVTWHPPHIKHGRFGNWLRGNVDWALSRERYWGTPLPIWRCENRHVVCVGSRAELEQRSGMRVEDPHRPYVDEVRWPCPTCGLTMTRVPEVIDVWFDSGAMPFAQHHAPPGDRAVLDTQFPADFVCEGLDQTRGVFYALLAVSTLLHDRPPYRDVLCLGLVVDSEGRKMSKSAGNAVDPWEMVERYGADAVRWYLYTARQPWDAHRFTQEGMGESARQLLLPLWTTYAFYVTYVNACGAGPREPSPPPPVARELDRWILSRLAGTAEAVAAGLDGFDTTNAARALAGFVEELSNWYVRRSRRRFWEEDPAAFATLRRCLLVVARLLAPFCPFVADEIYVNLDGSEASVHLCDFPTAESAGARDLELEQAMAVTRETVRLGLLARHQARMKVRQPLHAAVVAATGGERAAIDRMREIVREELNVKQLRFASTADELGQLEIKPNYRSLGPRFGPRMPRLEAALASLAPENVVRALRTRGQITVWIAGHDHVLGTDDLEIATAPLAGHHVAREGDRAVALELELDDELRQEGLAREVIRAVQAARRAAGLAVSARIALTLGGDATLLAAARAHEEHLASETLATTVSYDRAVDGHAVEIDRRRLLVAARQAAPGPPV